MPKKARLLHPEYFAQVPFKGKVLKDEFEKHSTESESAPAAAHDITVAIRTLNEAAALKILLEDIRAQQTKGSIEIVIVDNESTDETVQVAESFGAKVVTLERDSFTYPKSMNLALEAATNEYVFLTVGHAKLVSTNSLQAGLNELSQPNVTAVFGHALPGTPISWVERLIAMGNIHFARRRIVTKPELGFMAATGLMLRKSVWQELGGFDERYEVGGEDGALGALMLKKGYTIIDSPMVNTHHTHGLGLIKTVKQWIGWVRSSKPRGLNRKKLVRNRPHLRLKD